MEDSSKKDTEKYPLLEKLRNIEIPPDILSLSGILEGPVPDDIDVWELKYEYLKEKYDL